ncbi:MAG: dihydroorotase [Candidatus Adiutrix sp.]|jgi:dihydroorotase|nr:dihydroorotase [Candidatus Adiutrix sp.]
MTSILIKNGRLIDPSQNIDGPRDMLLKNGLVAALERPGALPEAGSRVIDARNRWVLPGLIDMHVHLREPGHEYKETVASGARAAAAGGFTAVVAMPNTSPVMDKAEVAAAVMAKGRQAGAARVWPAAAMTLGRQGEELAEYEDLKAAGAVAVTDDGAWVTDPKVFRRVLDYAAVTGLPALSHAEDHALSKGGAVHEGRVSTRLGLPGIPAQAEINAVMRDINMVELSGRPLHFCHISTAGAIEAIRAAKKRGLPVSCETAPHYLFLTHEAVGDYDANAKMNPPLRAPEDMAALRAALTDGVVDVIATDHAPHSVLEKEVEFIDAAFGVIGLETSLPLMMELVAAGVITPGRLAELMSTRPAALLNLPGGSLAPGRPADVTIVDPDLSFALKPEDSLSLSKNSPFWGRPFKGRATQVIVGGIIVHELAKAEG